MRRPWTAWGILAAIGAVAAAVAGAAGIQGAQAATLSRVWYASAPYLMPLDNNPPYPVAVMNATGQKTLQPAFILAPSGGGCSPTWDGTSPVSSDTRVGALIDRVRSNGGDVSVSVGGYNGTKLGQA